MYVRATTGNEENMNATNRDSLTVTIQQPATSDQYQVHISRKRDKHRLTTMVAGNLTAEEAGAIASAVEVAANGTLFQVLADVLRQEAFLIAEDSEPDDRMSRTVESLHVAAGQVEELTALDVFGVLA